MHHIINYESYAKKKKKKIVLIISGTVILVLLVVGGIFLLAKKSSPNNQNPPPSLTKDQQIIQLENQIKDLEQKQSQSQQDKDEIAKLKKELAELKKNTPPPGKNPPSDNPNDEDPPTDPPKPNSNDKKTEIKIFWSGFEGFDEKYDDYWLFRAGTYLNSGKERFLISQKHPVLVGKNLKDGDLSFTLAYSEKEVVKEVEKTRKDGSPALTILKSGFDLTPDSPLPDDPDFLDRWARGYGGATKEKVKFVGEDGENLCFNNNFGEGESSPFKGFFIKTDSLLARQLINFEKHKLQPGKKFILAFTEFAEHDSYSKNGGKVDMWYFDSSCDKKFWLTETN